ncbi:MAG: DMT family transporter [Paracoccaceae bacterium]|nr:DMT family transporter [Paracoccaceae bacterium]
MQTSETSITARPQTAPVLLWAALIAIGIGWGITGPLSKLSVSTGNHPIGIVFWNSVIGACILTPLLAITGRRLPLGRPYLIFFMVCGFLGTALPNTTSYTGYQHLPVGVMSIMLALVPIMTLLLALPFRLERPEPLRVLGLGFGAVAVALIALPDTSLPDPGQAVWVILPMIVTLAYAAENIYIAARRPPGLDALTILCGLFWGALIQITPVMLAWGAWVDLTRLDAPEIAIIVNSGLHILAYMGFVWLIGSGGPVFASQVAYVVTGVGVLLGMLVYDERHSLWIWGALALIFAGLALVKPKQ